MSFDLGQFASDLAKELKVGTPAEAAATLKKNLDLAKEKKSGNAPAGISAAIEATPYVEEKLAEQGMNPYLKMALIGAVAVAGAAYFLRKA